MTIVVDRIADKTDKRDGALAALIEAQIRTEERFRETDKRFVETGDRIDKLVSAIGEFIHMQAAITVGVDARLKQLEEKRP